jgi:hypothetical protein
VVEVFAHPDATKNRGIGDSIVSHSHRGYNSMMLTPRNEPSAFLSMTDIERCPMTTSNNEQPRAMSMAPRRDRLAAPFGGEVTFAIQHLGIIRQTPNILRKEGEKWTLGTA